MNRNINFILLCMCFLVGIPAKTHAQEATGASLYVYAPGGQEKSFAINNIRKITFSGEAMNVYQVSGNAVQMSYTDISKLMFKPWSISNNANITIPGIKIYIVDETLFIESPEEMISVILYNMQGYMLKKIMPGSLSANMSLQGMPAGVFLVRILSRSGVNTYKITHY